MAQDGPVTTNPLGGRSLVNEPLYGDGFMSRERKRTDDDVTGCLAYVLLGLFFMPIVGLLFVLGKDPERKTLGWFLLIAGIIWTIIGAGSA